MNLANLWEVSPSWGLGPEEEGGGGLKCANVDI